MFGNGFRILATALAATALAAAQEPGISRAEFEALKARLSALEAENATLKEDLGAQSAAAANDQLALQINAIAANYQQGSVQTLRSKGATIGGEFRNRAYYSAGESATGVERDGGYVAGLARINFAFDVTRGVKFFLSADSVFSFGEGADTANTAFSDGGSQSGTALRLHEVWFSTEDTMGIQGLATKTGRQEVHLGNGLMVGSSDWFDGFTHDGTVISYGGNNGQWSIIGAFMAGNTQDFERFQSNTAFFTDHDLDELFVLYFNYAGFERAKFDLYVIHVNADQNAGNYILPRVGNFATGAPATGDAASHTTLGIRLFGDFDIGGSNKIRYNAEFAYQFGEDVTPTVEIEGMVLEVDLRYAFTAGSSKFEAYGRFLYASGPEDGETGFVPLFTDRHSNYSEARSYGARYGLADLMPLNNVLSFQGGLMYMHTDSLTFGFTALYSEADERVLNPTGDDAYGFEFDLWASWADSEFLTYTAGAAVVFPDDQGEALWGLSDETQVLFFFQARLLF